MHKPESVQENETYKFWGDFETQTNKTIPVGRPNVNKPNVN